MAGDLADPIVQAKQLGPKHHLEAATMLGDGGLVLLADAAYHGALHKQATWTEKFHGAFVNLTTAIKYGGPHLSGDLPRAVTE
ncbi:MAG: hypothetical protein ABI450_10095 [Rhizomicrobium sp.]